MQSDLGSGFGATPPLLILTLPPNLSGRRTAERSGALSQVVGVDDLRLGKGSTLELGFGARMFSSLKRGV